jgi:excinuclease ABC subunit B
MPPFKIVSDFRPTGDQPQAVEKLVEGLERGHKHQTLLGVTGSGKTFTMANIIERVNRPTLVMSHNKTLAAQLATELKEFFPENAVEYFVSYYDYYQPEAYIPRTDTYIEKETDINEEIDKMRHASTRALFTRRDVIIVASVSCIYGLGSPEEYHAFVVSLQKGEKRKRDKIVRQLVDMQYERNDIDFTRGRFRIRGDTLEIQPAYEEVAVRVEFFGDEIERIMEVDPLTGELLAERESIDIYPAKHFVTSHDKLMAAIVDIEKELEQRLKWPGSPPWTLLDYFPEDFLVFIDESHMTLPQVRGMYHGDRSRKETLVEYGFRLPSALDNRPLNFSEFEEHVNQAIYVSATPGPYEYEHSEQIAEQLIRPTGLLEPSIEVKPTRGQIDDLMEQIKKRVERGERCLVTTMTKRMAEELADYLKEMGTKTHYLHSEINTLERVEILRDLRLGVYDVVVGINLLREGLDLPEVSLVAILDADKEGFLRSRDSLIQTMGRAARHVDGQVIMYADTTTGSMQAAIDEVLRRRNIQTAYNQAHGITPQGIKKAIKDITDRVRRVVAETHAPYTVAPLPKDEMLRLIKDLESQMKTAARNLEFEKAALLRDRVIELRRDME